MQVDDYDFIISNYLFAAMFAALLLVVLAQIATVAACNILRKCFIRFNIDRKVPRLRKLSSLQKLFLSLSPIALITRTVCMLIVAHGLQHGKSTQWLNTSATGWVLVTLPQFIFASVFMILVFYWFNKFVLSDQLRPDGNEKRRARVSVIVYLILNGVIYGVLVTIYLLNYAMGRLKWINNWEIIWIVLVDLILVCGFIAFGTRVLTLAYKARQWMADANVVMLKRFPIKPVVVTIVFSSIYMGYIIQLILETALLESGAIVLEGQTNDRYNFLSLWFHRFGMEIFPMILMLVFLRPRTKQQLSWTEKKIKKNRMAPLIHGGMARANGPMSSYRSFASIQFAPSPSAAAARANGSNNNNLYGSDAGGTTTAIYYYTTVQPTRHESSDDDQEDAHISRVALGL